jgi:chemotaxis protein histidine kinase CheA
MSTVSGIGASDSSLINWQANMTQFQTNFENLGNALQSGDLTAAQQAFSTLLQGTSSSNNPQDNIQSDFDALGKALDSGDMAAAKKAFSKLEQDMQALKTSRHHHHHHKQAAQSDADSNLQTVSDNTGTTSGNIASDDSVNTLV